MLANNDHVAILQMVFGYFFIVDERAVGAAQVLDERIVPHGKDIGVFAADGQVVNHDFASGLATYPHVALFQIDMIDNLIVELDNDFCHIRTPVL
jgi:hypothetical protein